MRHAGRYLGTALTVAALALSGCARPAADLGSFRAPQGGAPQGGAPQGSALPVAALSSVAPQGGLLRGSVPQGSVLQAMPPDALSRASTVGVMPSDVLSSTARRSLPFLAARPREEPLYSNGQLLRNFLSIALQAEAADDIGADGGIAISKWDSPIRYRLAGAQVRDRVQIAALSQHLASLTGLDIREAGEVERYNMDIRFVPRAFRAMEVDELLATQWLGPQVAGLAKGWRDYEADRCFTLTTRDPRSGVTGTAHVFIKDELPLIWRETCIIEEMTQSLGLLNDDPRASPSIFNDDGVYQALTSHDELLLRILYDPRIRSGMRRQGVVPLAERVIADLRPGLR